MNNKSVLYQKYRPRNFTELIGQDHIIKTLKSEIINGEVSNAYIFSGTRGTGKTSLARIFAKALNCENLSKDVDPCGVCSVCVDIDKGNFIDLIEIDAASNRGIDDIREIRNKVQFSPSVGRYKVYIIDEAHMLTSDAFNALLKTLEEPPESIIFILATTEINKLPKTIISRCQQFDFYSASDLDLKKYFDIIILKEKYSISDDVKSLIIKNARGSFRDMLSNLQKISHFKNELSYDDVVKILGLPDDLRLQTIWVHTLQGNIAEAISDISGENLQSQFFINESLDLFRRLLIYKVAGITDIYVQEFEKNVGINISVQHIINILNILIKSIENLKLSSSSLLTVQLALVEVYNSFAQKEISNVSSVIKEDKNEGTLKTVNKLKREEPPINQNKISDITEKWLLVIDRSKPFNHHMSGFLQKSNFNIEGDTFILVVPFKFYKDMLVEEKSKEFLRDLLKDVFMKDFKVDCIVDKSVNPIVSFKKDSKANEITSSINDVFDVDEESV
jgi:DNA polymerase-3 subunit gamma/tau